MLEVVWRKHLHQGSQQPGIPNSPELGHRKKAINRGWDKPDIHTVGHLLSNTKG